MWPSQSCVIKPLTHKAGAEKYDTIATDIIRTRNFITTVYSAPCGWVKSMPSLRSNAPATDPAIRRVCPSRFATSGYPILNHESQRKRRIRISASNSQPTIPIYRMFKPLPSDQLAGESNEDCQRSTAQEQPRHFAVKPIGHTRNPRLDTRPTATPSSM